MSGKDSKTYPPTTEKKEDKEEETPQKEWKEGSETGGDKLPE